MASQTFICETCGKSFERAVGQFRGVARFCSHPCYLASPRSHEGGRSQRKPPEERTCEACGKVFLVGGRGNPMRRQRLCSLECQQRARYRRGSVALELTPVEAAYMAGLVDGEGSIMLQTRGSGTMQLRFTVTNGHRGVLEWLTKTTGVGNIVNHYAGNGSTHRPNWNWVLNGEAAMSVLRQLRPYMIVKTEQADIAVDFFKKLRTPALKADRVWQTEAQQRMRDLNASRFRVVHSGEETEAVE